MEREDSEVDAEENDGWEEDGVGGDNGGVRELSREWWGDSGRLCRGMTVAPHQPAQAGRCKKSSSGALQQVPTVRCSLAESSARARAE